MSLKFETQLSRREQLLPLRSSDVMESYTTHHLFFYSTELLKQLGVLLLSSLDWQLFYRRVIHSVLSNGSRVSKEVDHPFFPVFIYTPGWRKIKWSKVA